MTAAPLAGVRVVDFTAVLSGPFGTQLLADLGADVIKIEPPGGDTARAMPPHYVGEDSAYFLGNNRGKRSIAVDLKTSEGLEIVRRAIGEADVVVENFRPGVCARLGLDPAVLLEAHPRLIWASISGFGQQGENRDRPAFDIVVQAMSGVMSLTGQPDGPVVRLGVPLGDLLAGVYSVVGILATLVSRERPAAERWIDIAMYDGLVSMLSYQAVFAMLTGRTPLPQGTRHDTVPTYREFVGSDGRQFVVAAMTQTIWERMCDAIDHAALILDERFRTSASRLVHKEALWEVMEQIFSRRPAAEWEQLLNEAGVPAAVVRSVPEALAEARADSRGMVLRLKAEDGREISVPGNPIRTAANAPGAGAGDYPPRLGEHTEAVLAEIGYPPEQIGAFLESRIVFSAESASATGRGPQREGES